jgi:hypothetical protein
MNHQNFYQDLFHEDETSMIMECSQKILQNLDRNIAAKTQDQKRVSRLLSIRYLIKDQLVERTN